MNTLFPNTSVLSSGLRYREEASSDDWTRVVQAFPLFSGIGRRSLRKLVRQARLLEFTSGETVIAPDEPADSIHVVLSGTATTRGATKPRTFHVGDHFGAVGLADDDLEMTVVAVDQLHVMRLSHASFHRHTQRGGAISFTRMRSRRSRPLTTQPARR